VRNEVHVIVACFRDRLAELSALIGSIGMCGPWPAISKISNYAPVPGDQTPSDCGIARASHQRLVDLSALDDIMLFFGSDASRQVTGTAITIDDGQSL
jgi:hypothetical protein